MPNHSREDTKGDEPLVLFVPSEPDVSVPHKVEEATKGEAAIAFNTKHDEKLSQGACCQVEIHVRSNHFRSLLYTRNCHGQRKRMGGDEFYIRYEEYAVDTLESKRQPSSTSKLLLQAVALITDLGDGSYELEFSTTPMNPSLRDECCDTGEDRVPVVAVWTVYFEYTNGIGSLPSPLKGSWPNGGYTHTVYSKKGVPLLLRPFIREFRPPAPCIDLSVFEHVFVFGDSTFCQFVRQRPNKKGKYYFQPNLRVLGGKVSLGLSTKTVSVLLQLLEQSNIDGVLSKVDSGAKRALIVGSCLWDILDSDDELQGRSYDDHAHACTEFVCGLRKKYPKIVVIWKSPMACHSKLELAIPVSYVWFLLSCFVARTKHKSIG
jgi:hypothetical protein